MSKQKIRDSSPAMLELVRTAFHYDSELGGLVWRLDWGDGKAGEIAGCVKVLKQSKSGAKIRIVGLGFKKYAAHQLVWFWHHGVWAKLIDHRDGNPLNNRIENLREASSAVNAQNRRAASRNNKLGVLGVSQAGKNFSAQITIPRKSKHLGTFKTAAEAHLVYVQAKRKYHRGCTL